MSSETRAQASPSLIFSEWMQKLDRKKLIHLKYGFGGRALQRPWTSRKMDKGVLEQMKPETSLEAKMTNQKLTERKTVGSWGVTLSTPHRPETETQRGLEEGGAWG